MNQPVQLMPGYAQGADRLLIQIAGSRLGHRANGILGIAGRTDLARYKHIEREMEGEAELVAHCHSASGKGQNETPRVVTILQQLSDKLTACLFTVLENH
jgi:hypothetical protein